MTAREALEAKAPLLCVPMEKIEMNKGNKSYGSPEGV